MHTLLLSLLLPTALAADSDGDGCVDSYYDANEACVATTATLDPSVVVQAGATVRNHVSIGADTTLAFGVYVGDRTTITGRVSAPGSAVVYSSTTIGRSVTIGADHTFGSDNSIGRSTTIGERIDAGNNVSIGYAATIGDDVTLGTGAVAGSLVSIGDNTTVESSAVLARGVTILDSLSSASIGGIIGPEVQIGADATISTTARIRKRAILGDNVTVLGNARVGRDAQIGDGATIGANVRIAAGAQVTANSDVPDGTVVAHGEVFDNAVGEFVGGTLLSPTEQDQINQWVGDSDANWELCYKLSVNGRSGSAFHTGCNSYASTVTVVVSGSKKFGGYTPISWSTNTWSAEPTQSSFLFSLTNSHRHSLTGASNHIYAGSSYGPTWGGGHDLMVYRDGGNPYCNMGTSYACRPGYSGNACKTDFCGSTGNFTLNEVEVYGRL